MDLFGVTAVRWRNRRPGLYCFNFHRVGNDDGTAFHPNLYSCTGARFAELVQFLQQSFEMIGLDRLVQMIEVREAPNQCFGMITFDDGYADNFEVAYPILRELNCAAVFFLPTDFIDGNDIPWWDQIAWCVAQLGDGKLHIPGVTERLIVRRSDLRGSIRRVLRAVKSSPAVSMADKVDAIRRQVGLSDPHKAVSGLFMSWEHVKEMRRGGMWFGSHCASHRILSHLSEAEQWSELSRSKRALESNLGEPVTALSYPVGGYDSYTAATQRLAKDCGYRLAFNFTGDGGVNGSPGGRPYELVRMAVDGNMNTQELRRMVALARVY